MLIKFSKQIGNSLAKIINTKVNSRIPGHVLGQQFLVYDNGRPDRILLFGTDEGFRFLSNSQDWFLDGTGFLNQAQFNLCNCTPSTD